MRRWGRWGHYEGLCTDQHCVYEVELPDFAYEYSNLFVNRPWAWHLYRSIGGRPARVNASWEVEDGIVSGKRCVVHVEVPPQAGQALGGNFGYTLIASAHSVSRHSFYSQQPELLLHPNYVIGKPGGCSVCQMVYTYFTPYVDPADVNRLMTFNLACLTAWHPCRTQGDIMPVAWKQYLDELPRWEAYRERIRRCDYPLDLLARDSDDAGLFEVISSQQTGDISDRMQIVKANLVRKLKGLEKFQAGSTQDVKVFDNAFQQHGSDKLTPHGQWILLLEDRSFQGHKPALQVDPCGAIPATQSNMDAIQRGIRLDYAAFLPKH
jgi:hypothetical protein